MYESKKKERLLPIEIYTDGALKKIGDIVFGGWAFIVTREGKQEYAGSGSAHGTTNQRMELIAAIEALEYIKFLRRKSEKVIIYSDSAYLVNCYTQEWYKKWECNGWLNANKKDVANKDLWLKLVPFFENFWYDFQKVRGHSGVIWNEKCDSIAQLQAQTIKDSWRGIYAE